MFLVAILCGYCMFLFILIADDMKNTEVTLMGIGIRVAGKKV